MKTVYRLGLDIGSTTAKAVVLDAGGEVVFSAYERHHADIEGTVTGIFDNIGRSLGSCSIAITITGSVGMGVAERFSVDFIQEVIAATKYVRSRHSEVSTIIDIGGEDAKIVYLKADGNADLRMNGNCAGGTGAFIDQMAALLNVDVGELDALAGQASHRYPIASRCGVFSKTDVQNLISKNVSKPDIVASIFHAVTLQTITTLAHGCDLEPKVLFCGGPLTFIAALRRAFIDYLDLPEEDYVIPEDANLIPAWGAALSCDMDKTTSLEEFAGRPQTSGIDARLAITPRLPEIFGSEEEYGAWKITKKTARIEKAPLKEHTGFAFLGIDSGSTTTKLIVTDGQDRVLFSYYAPNQGNSINAVKVGLQELKTCCDEAGVKLDIKGSCSTGYGEDLIKAAFGLEQGVIETIAHYVAAKKVDPEVSFILDIGGQDMKAIFVDHGVLSRMEINEACSSGCGSFLETFAKSLNYTVSDFATEACRARSPFDLGTRCTVFMNSKVKQVMREGASIGDIAAGLSYSVVKNCLYKVLKLKKTEEMGTNIVVQGGTMRNDSVVRVLELLTGATVSRSDMPELMGAYGCAIHAREMASPEIVSVEELLATAAYTSKSVECRGCENHCLVNTYRFSDGGLYHSGNKCEKVFSNRGTDTKKGRNISTEKYDLIFGRESIAEPRGKIGIPRALNMYENYPFWHALLTESGFQVVLSANSTYKFYEAGLHSVMSDNICFPAKLLHSHVYDLIDKGVDRIFFPWVVFEKWEGEGVRNSYNCPVVAGYSEVIKSAIVPPIPVDAPVITFKDEKMTRRQCVKYLKGLGVDTATARKAVDAAITAQDAYERELKSINMQALEETRNHGGITIVLAGRPYHTDPLVQHKLSDMISDMGVTVITEDVVRGDDSAGVDKAHLVTQWSYINRILRAAQWAAQQGDDVHFMQMTSFGCGPDAFLLDEVKDILKRHGKSFTLLKIDDVNNIGSLKLRVRSVIDSIRFGQPGQKKISNFITTKVFEKEDRRRTIIAPFFTEYVSPLVPAAFRLAGYNFVQLPESDMDSAEYGLKYANNEVCYPATLVVGDLIKALDSGKYDLDDTAVIITQTGGQCRATNYVALLKRAMVEAGFEKVPVLSMAMGSSSVNAQPGFKVDFLKFLPAALAAIIFGDALSKFYHSSVVREKAEGDALRLRDYYLGEAEHLLAANRPSAIYDLVGTAAEDFNSIINDGELPRVGIVGEIYLKFNGFANKRVADWFIDKKIEVIPPVLTDFFMEAFVNRSVKHKTGVQKASVPLSVMRSVYGFIWKKIEKVNEMGARFKYFTPFNNIYEEAEHGKEIISLSAQFGEGWLLPAEVVTFARMGVNNVVSLQPFGCIANHIVSKGVEKRIKKLYPQMNLLFLDFDSGVSDVNVTNRLMLMANNMK